MDNYKVTAIIDASTTIERAILGTMVLDVTGASAGMACSTLSEGDFSGTLHKSVFKAIKHLLGRGVTVLDYSMIIAELQAMGVMQQYASGHALVSSLGEDIRLRPRAMQEKIAELQRLARHRHHLVAAERSLRGDRA